LQVGNRKKSRFFAEKQGRGGVWAIKDGESPEFPENTIAASLIFLPQINRKQLKKFVIDAILFR